MANFHIGFSALVLFCFLRPLAFIHAELVIGGLNIFELFAITISYILLVNIALNIRRIEFDLISITILWFCALCLISVIWGSQIKGMAQITLPFVLFFAARLHILKAEDIKLLITLLIIAFCFPVLGSLYEIIQGGSILHIESITGFERHAGLFKRIKTLSYAMFFISVFFYMQVYINKIRSSKIKLALLVLLFISIFCLYKTYSRTTFLGFIIFWGVSLWGYNKKYFLVGSISLFIVVVLYLGIFQQIFFKTPEFDLNIASSGRLLLWEHNINIFLESSFDRKFLGHGIGVGSSRVIGGPNEIWSSHNNYLHLLMQLGIIGLIGYLSIFLLLLKDIYYSLINKNTKYFYYGVIFSILLMNFFSDVSLYNVGISQLFWLVIGFFYVYRNSRTNAAHSL